VGKWVCVWV